MSDETSKDSGRWFVGRFSDKLNIRLAGAVVGLLLALLIAPATRRLFLTQTGLTVPFPAAVASIAGSQLGIKPDPFEGRLAIKIAHRFAGRHPDDLQLQIADAVRLMPEDANVGFVRKVQRLRALESRFADRPALYANILRYTVMGEIRVHHEVEQYDPTGDIVPQRVSKAPTASIDAAAYAAYDRDAAAGERLDPDNAYFSFMRAVGLFGAHCDDEALAAISRAAEKSQWREYYGEEVKGQWRLQDEAFVNNSALFHALSAAATLFPQYAQVRAAARVIVSVAIKDEEMGRFDEGLALRRNVVRLGSLMRVQSASLIGSLVGIALTEIAAARPAGAPAIKVNARTELKDREQQQRQFDAYLQRVGAAASIPFFDAEHQAGKEARIVIEQGMGISPFDRPLQSLLLCWVINLLTLSNILWLFILGGIAALCLRTRGLQSGKALPGHMRLALPLGLIGGALAAPALLTWLSPCFQNIADGDRISLLQVGLAPALLLLVLPTRALQDRMRRLGVFGCALLAGALLTGFCVWQMRGIAGIAGLMEIYINLGGSGQHGPNLVSGLLWFTPCVSVLLLIVITCVSLACRVPLSVGLARGFLGLMVPVAATLFLVYGGTLLYTVRAETEVQSALDRTLENEGRYIADLSGKLWPRSDIARKMIDP